MTRLLEKALQKASMLPAREQNTLARIMLEELASEQAWAKSFAKSQDKLSALADEALSEGRQGRGVPLEKSI